MNDIYEGKKYSYELNPEMLKLLDEEFSAEKITDSFCAAVKGKKPDEIDKIGEKIFTDYGREWIRKTHKLGEEYPDRTYEVLLEAIDKTGGYLRFSLVPQRFIEIAYLSTQDISILPIVENNKDRLVYKMVECLTFKKLKEKCGAKVADQLPCRHACLTACDVLHQDLDIDAQISMDASIPKDGYCQFTAKRA